jgi:hypothetical protein
VDQAVLDGLLRDVTLGEVVEQLRIDSVEPAAEAFLDLVGVLAVERPTPAP